MNARCLAFALILTLLAAATALRAEPPAPPAEAPAEEEIDILKVSPAELRGADTRALVAEAHAAYNEKRYEDAARAFIRSLRRNPGDGSALYNLACCYGLLGAAEPAVGFLEAAYDAGFRDLGHVRRDPDFAKVRETPGFVALMEKLAEKDEENRKARGSLLHVEATTVQVVRVVEPSAGIETWKRYPLLIGLHGFGSNAESFARLFVGRGVEQPFLYVAAQAPYASHGGARIGFSWTWPGDEGGRATGIATHLLTERYVLEVLETVKRHYPVDERNVFLLGFSQGAGQAFSIGLKHPELFRGVIPIGGWCDAAEHPPSRIVKAAKHGLFLVCHSREDRVVEWKACEEAEKLLSGGGIAHAILEYPGGHSIPVPLTRAIAAWIADPKPTAPVLPAEEAVDQD